MTNHNELTDFYLKFDFEITSEWVKENNPIFSYAIYEEGRIIGGVTLSYRLGCYILDYIGVTLEYRKQGIARKLFGKAVEELIRLGADKMYLVAKVPEFFIKQGAKFATDTKGLVDECKECELYNKSCNPKVMIYEV